ncbi:hypothetical protein J3E73DRAFT_373373 [Bipolaris maydis]|nr:hypothetical protein J3E73DRAFT_373373 [Bipolaris maydis]
MLCGLPEVIELIEYHQGRGSKSLETVASKEDRSMIRSILASARRLSRYDVQVSIVEDGEEEVAPSPSSRTTNHVNAETAGDEEEDGGSDVEGNGVDDGKKGEMIAHIWNMR